MSVITRIYILCLVGLVASQDYQDYENAPRAAPSRLGGRSGGAPLNHQQEVRPTPIPILKQINRHNEDGSYTYGYEGADGSFKIETKLATGEVKGKYGYVDETGKVRVVEYGANKYGFQPSGDGITVAPPTLVDETTNKDNLPDYDDEPQIPQKQYVSRVNRPQHRPAPPPPPPQRPQYVDYDQEQEPEPPRRPQYAPAPVAGPVPPRIQITGAQPVGVTYSQEQRPARPDAQYSQSQNFGGGPPNVRLSRPVYAPAPVPIYQPQQQPQQQQPQHLSRAHAFAAGPQPQNVRPVSEPIEYQPPSQHVPQAVRYPVPSSPQGRSTSVLDQLAKDYALPQGGAQPLHDISFGYY